MKISIITTCLNSSKTIINAIQSVNSQSYTNIEHIFVDGFSDDNTLEIIKSNSTINYIIISEKDSGLYDAMNKGIKTATGDIIGILNSDDIFAYKDSLSNIAKIFNKSSCSVVYGNIEFFEGNKIKRRWKVGPFNIKNIKNGWHPAHPSFFVSRELVVENNIYYDTSYKIGADLKWMITILRLTSDVIYLNRTLTYMRIGGASTSLKGIFISFKELFKTYTDLGFSKFNTCLIISKRYFFKLKQLFAKEENIYID